MEKTAYISEIFSSIQGEGLYIGERQLFIRFCGCNLNCDFCDTDFKKRDFIKIFDEKENVSEIKNPINCEDLKKVIDNFLKTPHPSISLTGGEPLLYTDFLIDFLPEIRGKNLPLIYLETNGSLPQELKKIINLVDIIAMDIKLKSVTGDKNRFEENEEFIKIASEKNKEIFVKIILNKNYDIDELKTAIDIIKKYNLYLIIQPANYKDKTKEFSKEELVETINNIINIYPKTRLIPQVHNYLNLL